jgi:chromosome segregation ATPase
MSTDERIEALAQAVIGNLSDLRQEINARFDRVDQRLDTIERRTERMETNLGALLMQTAGMSKSLTDAERIDSAMAATQAAQQRAIDQLAQRVARLERQANPGAQQ